MRELAQVRRIGIQAQMVDPESPGDGSRVPIDKREPVREVAFSWSNYTEPLQRSHFTRFFGNSLFVTVVATLITLLINSMAAYALSIYEFRGKNAAHADGDRHADDPDHHHAGTGVSGRHQNGPEQFALGSDPAGCGDADWRFSPAAIHADPAARSHRGRAHGQGLGVADLLRAS